MDIRLLNSPAIPKHSYPQCCQYENIHLIREIDALSGEDLEKFDQATKESALGFFKAFKAEGSASTVKSYIEGK